MVTPRRNPPRSATTRQNGASTRPRPPNARVTRSAAVATRRSAHLHADPATDASDGSSDFGDDEDDGSPAENYTHSIPLRSRPVRTIASTRARRRPAGQAPISQSFTVSKAATAPSTPKKRSKSVPRVASARKKSPLKSGDKPPPWPTSKVIPPWARLEWSHLVQIFDYAAHPLDSKTNVRWLLSAGLTCKAFLAPALKALYRCPTAQTISMNMATKFACLMRELALADAQAKDRNDYRRSMVESLVVNVTLLPSQSQSQSRSFDVAELISNLPSLSHVELYHEFDLPPYRKLDVKATRKWTYTAELLNAIKVAGDSDNALRLKAWKWSGRMMRPDLLGEMKDMYKWSTFSSLRNISLVNFQVPSLGTREDPNDPDVYEKDKNYIGLVAGSLEAAPELKHLVLESSTIVDEQFLSLLPKTIEHLEIINCWELTSEMLSEFLLTHGRTLHQLTLNHNQSLNLSFLPLLAQCCPNLREFHMDLLLFSHHEYLNDKEPNYDILMSVVDVPSWPATLEVIELEQLAKWDLETAEMFFQSLINQAPNLPKLRYLAIKAMLDVPWRQRSAFRDKWVSKLKRVFLRKSTGPKSFHSLIQWPTMKGGAVTRQEWIAQSSEDELLPTRRSTRIATQAVPVAPPPKDEPSATRRKRRRAPTLTRDLRDRKRAHVSYKDPDTDEGLTEPEESDDEDPLAAQDSMSVTSEPASPSPEADSEPFIHGLCDVVNILLDNQKPRELQWGIEDFLDNESGESQDGEWTSDERFEESDGYAW